MVKLGVVWGHWWLQCRGNWQYLQHTCASSVFARSQFQTYFHNRKLPPPNKDWDLPLSLKQQTFFQKVSPKCLASKLNQVWLNINCCFTNTKELNIDKASPLKVWGGICVWLPAMTTILAAVWWGNLCEAWHYCEIVKVRNERAHVPSHKRHLNGIWLSHRFEKRKEKMK